MRGIFHLIAFTALLTSNAWATGESSFGVIDGIFGISESDEATCEVMVQGLANTLSVAPEDTLLIERLKNTSRIGRPAHLIVLGGDLILGIVPMSDSQIAKFCEDNLYVSFCNDLEMGHQTSN